MWKCQPAFRASSHIVFSMELSNPFFRAIYASGRPYIQWQWVPQVTGVLNKVVPSFLLPLFSIPGNRFCQLSISACVSVCSNWHPPSVSPLYVLPFGLSNWLPVCRFWRADIFCLQTKQLNSRILGCLWTEFAQPHGNHILVLCYLNVKNTEIF